MPDNSFNNYNSFNAGDTNQNNNIDNNVNFSQNNNYQNFNNNVLYDDNALQSPKEKVQDFFSTINKRAAIVIIGLLLFVILVGIIIFSIISKINSTYKTEIIIPEIVYMGESSKITVTSKGKSKSKNTVTKLENKNTSVIQIIDLELKDDKNETYIIPLKEGKTIVEAKATSKTSLGKRIIEDKKQQIVVCPAFDSTLLINSNINLKKDTTSSLNIDFGESECAKDVVYESSNPNILTVDNAGNIKGIEIGKAILNIKKGSKVISLNVNVTENSVGMATFYPSFSKLHLNIDDIVRLNITPDPIDSSFVKPTIKYDSSFLAVSSGGKIKAIQNGSTKIVISVNNKEATIPIYIGPDITPNATIIANLETVDEIKLIQGESKKILVNFVPDNINNKDLTWSSSNNDIVYVNNKGVILAKNIGNANIMINANNNVSKSINVTVENLSAPSIKSNDSIESDNWHNEIYTLNISGFNQGTEYYYGNKEDKLDKTGKEIIISEDGQITYFVKACKNGYCSTMNSYISKLDTEKPKVIAVAGLDSNEDNNIKIALEDNISFINKWCVTSTDNQASCIWNTVSPKENPVVNYEVKENGTYYVFTKDTAGNISDSYKFETTKINEEV